MTHSVVYPKTHAAPEEGKDSEAQTILPFLGLSSHALLALLTRWSVATPRRGGLNDPKHRMASAELLLSLLDAARGSSAGASVLWVSLVGNWSIAWPRPDFGEHEVSLVWNADGMLDMQGWVAQVKASHPCAKKCWWHAQQLETWIASLPSFTIYDVLTQSSVTKGLGVLHTQLTWQVGQMLETLAGQVTKGNRRSVMVVRDMSFEDAFDSAAKLDLKLVRYVESGVRRAAANNIRSISLCTDKASVGGLGGGVQSTVFVLGESNIGIVGVPQVHWDSIGSRARPVCLGRHGACSH